MVHVHTAQTLIRYWRLDCSQNCSSKHPLGKTPVKAYATSRLQLWRLAECSDGSRDQLHFEAKSRNQAQEIGHAELPRKVHWGEATPPKTLENRRTAWWPLVGASFARSQPPSRNLLHSERFAWRLLATRIPKHGSPKVQLSCTWQPT
jgi:hypothetical protein